MNIPFDRARLALLLLLMALLGVGMWAYRGVGESLREIRATGMQTLLNTQVGTLEQWIAERRHEAEQLAALFSALSLLLAGSTIVWQSMHNILHRHSSPAWFTLPAWIALALVVWAQRRRRGGARSAARV